MLLTPAAFDGGQPSHRPRDSIARRFLQRRPSWMRRSITRLRQRSSSRQSSRHPISIATNADYGSNAPTHDAASDKTIVRYLHPNDALRSQSQSPRASSDSDETITNKTVSSYDAPSPPTTSPRLSTTSARARMVIEFDRVIIGLENGYKFEKDEENREPRGLMDLPKKLRNKIWRMVLVDEGKHSVCGCKQCDKAGIAHLPIVQVSHSIRLETLPIFYSENKFISPVGHKHDATVHHWLRKIGGSGRKHLRSLEIPALDVKDTAATMQMMWRLKPASRYMTRDHIGMQNGSGVYISWVIFKATIDVADNIDSDDEDGSVATIDTSILMLDGESDRDSLRSIMTTSSNSSATLTMPYKELPKLNLHRSNGGDMSNPRWSFADKFTNHVSNRLEAVSREPRVRSRTPMFARMPRRPIAKRATIHYEDPVYEDGELKQVLERLQSSRFSSGSWVLGMQ